MFNFTNYKSPIQEGIRLPKFKPSTNDLESVGLKEGADNYDLLRKLCFKGIKSLGIDKLPNYDKYTSRAKHELQTLKDLCLVDYMLIVWDYLNFCKIKGIPRGPARGSCGGSLVAYLIGITEKVDPIKYNLYFERFLSVDRVQPKEINGEIFLKDCADIDTDISYYRRPEVLEYINTKYHGQTAQIATLTTLSGKLCIKECVKIALLGSEEDAQKISNLVERTFGIVNPLKQVCEEVPAFAEWAKANPSGYRIARKLEGLNKNYGVHASGIAVAPESREKIFPCQKTKDGHVVTSWEMGAIGDIAVKIDCLGLRTLDVLAVAEKESGIKMGDIDPEDRSIYKQFENLDHKYGLFQIETDAGFRVTKQIKPEHFSQLSDIVAINRPGAIQFLADYVSYKNGEKEIPKLHPIIDEILKDTGGVLLMQEQTMRILHEVYGFTLVEANQLRKVIGKKLRNEVGAWEEKIRVKGKELGISESITDWYWSSIKASADYQFNASHSKAYSFVTMYCAWYKANKPKEFFLGALKLALSETKPQEIISEISQELPRFGIKLLPPDLSRSSMEFKIEDGNIRYGLSAIKGIGEKKLEALQKFRDANKPNKYDIFLSAKQAEIGIGVLSSLIQAGTLDSFGEKRVDLVLEAQVFNKLSDREKRLFISLGEKYNNSVIKTIKACTEEKLVDEKGKPIISDKRLITLRKECSKYFEIRKLNSEHQSLASWYFERKLLGYSYSIRLRDCFQQGMLGSENLAKMEDWQKGVFVGVVTEVNKSVSKKGSAYMKITLSDENGMFNVMMIDNKRSQKFTEYINAGGVTPEEEDIIIVYGSKSGDIIFIDSIKIVSDEIYMKLSDLPDGKSVKSQEAVSTTSSA